MAKTYTIDLPITQQRELRYTRAERQDFEKRFRDRREPGMKELINKYVLPTKDLGNGLAEATGGGDLEVQEYLIFLGLRHLGNVITERRVADWLDLAVREEGRPLLAFLGPVVMAVFASGVLGFVHEIEATVEEVPPADEGKAATV